MTDSRRKAPQFFLGQEKFILLDFYQQDILHLIADELLDIREHFRIIRLMIFYEASVIHMCVRTAIEISFYVLHKHMTK